MSRRTIPSIHPTDLRDHAEEERIARIWDRLDHDLAGRERDKPRSATMMFALAAAALSIAAFSAGIWVGGRTTNEHEPQKIAAASSESGLGQSVLAAGSREAVYPLPSGGNITLAPGTTVELERSDDDTLVLRLLRGEVSVDATSTARSTELALVAEDARLSSLAGSVVFVRRNQTDIDVRVASGSVRLSWSDGSRVLASGEALDAFPMRALPPVSQISVDDNEARPSPTSTPAPRDIAHVPLQLPLRAETPTVAITAADWRVRYNAGELGLALELLRQQPGGIEGAIGSARSASELAAISDIARAKGGDPSAALKALTELVDRFPSDPYAEIASYTLGGMYEKLGQADKAQKYFERARSLKGVLAEDALCKQLRAEHLAGRKDEAERMGKEYVNKYPDGRCKEDVERILAGEELAREDDETKLQAAPDAGATGDASVP